MADAAHEGVVLDRVDELGVRLQRRGEAEDGLDGRLGRLHRGDDAPGGALEERGVGRLGALRLARQRVAADEAGRRRQQLARPLHHLRLGRAGVGDDRAVLQVVADGGEDLAHRAHRPGADDELGVAHGGRHVPGHLVGRLHAARLLLLGHVDVETDDAQRGAALLLRGRPAAQPEADRRADEPESDDRDLFHHRVLSRWGRCERARRAARLAFGVAATLGCPRRMNMPAKYSS